MTEQLPLLSKIAGFLTIKHVCTIIKCKNLWKNNGGNDHGRLKEDNSYPNGISES